ncbi:hypothetical protein BST43_26380 [Mycobacteroides saopaulense]|uniref:Uncharacterized protein n=1 Tax=Mycobacteroides saopaulense TaxID=1578165 RepID=A0A1X0IHU6_9MYCO|nr:hypothetical protein [Mycobacteroides saopaulense]ORB46971.1 hypothetical protein BST43_26380 [Mycobacteroides saopaulense]
MFENELFNTVDSITGWAGLGIRLSPELEKAVEVYETIRWTEVGHAFDIDIAKLAPADVESTIRDFAQHIITAWARQARLSPMGDAKLRMMSMSAAHIIKLSRQFAPEARDQLAVEFDTHAQAYTEAVQKLPEELTSESLIAAGPDAVSAYSAAQAEVEHLRQVRSWVSDIRGIPGLGVGDADLVLNVLRPSGIEQLHRLDAALHGNVDPVLGRIDPVFAAAVHEGVEFGINLPAESHRIRSELAYSPTIEFND